MMPTGHGRSLVMALRPQNSACALVIYELICPLRGSYVAITWFLNDLDNFSR